MAVRSLYNRFRYYDPSTGRYVNADPIGQAGGANLFAYAMLNPVVFADPVGLFGIIVGPSTSPAFQNELQGVFFGRETQDERECIQLCLEQTAVNLVNPVPFVEVPLDLNLDLLDLADRASGLMSSVWRPDAQELEKYEDLLSRKGAGNRKPGTNERFQRQLSKLRSNARVARNLGLLGKLLRLLNLGTDVEACRARCGGCQVAGSGDG